MERSVRLWRQMVDQARGGPVGIEHLCAVAIARVGVTSATVTVTSTATPRETLFATDQCAAELAELALTLGEGPSVDAERGRAALAPDLGGEEARGRWPVFAAAAVAAGIEAMFALPLQIGAIRLGVLDLFRATLLRKTARGQNRRLSDLATGVVNGTDRIPAPAPLHKPVG